MIRSVLESIATVTAVAALAVGGATIATAAPAADTDSYSLDSQLEHSGTKVTPVYSKTKGAPKVTFELPQTWTLDHPRDYYTIAEYSGTAADQYSTAYLSVDKLSGTPVDADEVFDYAKQEVLNEKGFTVVREETGTVSGGRPTYAAQGRLSQPDGDIYVTYQVVYVDSNAGTTIVRLTTATPVTYYDTIESNIQTMHTSLSIKP